MSASLDTFVNSAEFLWLQVGLAVWLYIRWIPLLRLPWILIRRGFKWEPIYARAKFMSCYLDVSYDITPLSGEPTTYGDPDVVVKDQTGMFSTRYTRSGNGYAAICNCGNQERIFLLDRGVSIQNFFQAVNLINEGYVVCSSMRSLFPGVYLGSHTDVFTFLEVMCASGCFCYYKTEVRMIIDREPLSMETPTYAQVFDTLPFIAQAKGYQVLSAIFSALSLLGSFFTPLPWIALNCITRVLKNGFQWSMGLTDRTNRILHFLSKLIPILRPLNTVTDKVSYIKFGVTYIKGGQALPRGYSLIPCEFNTGFIAAEQRLVYIFGNIRLDFRVTKIVENSVAVVDLMFMRDKEVHRYDGLCFSLEDLAMMDAVFSNWMRCYEIPPLLSHEHIGRLYECTQPTTLFQVLGDAIRRKSYHLTHMHKSIVE